MASLLKSLLRDVFARGNEKVAARAVSAGFDVASWMNRRQGLTSNDPTSLRSLVHDLSEHLRAQSAVLGNASPAAKELLAGWRLLGDWCLHLGDRLEAEAAFRQALHCNPIDAATQEGLGLTLLQLGRLDEAWLHLETAHLVDPMNSDVLVHWGLVALEQGNLSAAADRMQKAIDRNAANHHAWNNLGLILLRQGLVEEAVGKLERAVAVQAGFAAAHSNLALACLQAERVADALTHATRATEIQGGQARPWVVLSEVEAAGGNYTQAQAAISRALAIDAAHVGGLIAQAKLHMNRRQLDEARTSFEEALALSPGHADAEAGLSQLELLCGAWQPGWALYEARRRVPASPVRNFPFLEWHGEPMNDQVLLVHSEQGLGDAILFASCLPELQSRCAKVIVETPVRLARLFRRSFPWADVVGHEQTDNSSGWLGSHASVQRQIPIGSLPFHFRKTNEDFPSRAGYLLADPQAVADWRCKISDGQRKTIGISWRGGLALTAKFQRSLELETLARALATVDVALVNLQYGETGSEIQQLAKATGIELHPGLSGLADLDDLAALTSACDGVITVCSTLAHLAGALGMRGLVLVPTIANWRYGAGGTRSVWYPNLQLARQSAEGDWNGPLIRARGWAEQLQSAAGMHPAQAE